MLCMRRWGDANVRAKFNVMLNMLNELLSLLMADAHAFYSKQPPAAPATLSLRLHTNVQPSYATISPNYLEAS